MPLGVPSSGMTFDVAGALEEGLRRTVARNGLVVAALLFVLGAANELVGLGLARWYLAGTWWPPTPGSVPPAGAPVWGPLAGLLSLALSVASLVVAIAAVRTFATDETETVRREHFTRRMVAAWLNAFVGIIVFSVVLALGFALLLFPGLYLLAALGFWFVLVAVEDRNFVEGFRSSWELTTSRRLRVFLLLVAVFLIAAVVGAVFGVGETIGGVAGLLVVQVGVALTGTFTLATITRAYLDLRDAAAEEAATEAAAAGEAPAGA